MSDEHYIQRVPMDTKIEPVIDLITHYPCPTPCLDCPMLFLLRNQLHTNNYDFTQLFCKVEVDCCITNRLSFKNIIFYMVRI